IRRKCMTLRRKGSSWRSRFWIACWSPLRSTERNSDNSGLGMFAPRGLVRVRDRQAEQPLDVTRGREVTAVAGSRVGLFPHATAVEHDCNENRPGKCPLPRQCPGAAVPRSASAPPTGGREQERYPLSERGAVFSHSFRSPKRRQKVVLAGARRTCSPQAECSS